MKGCFKLIENIVVRNARVHNLKNVNVKIPRNKLICFTGLSGSGKSSLAFHTIYAEGQRRYIESLSSYARQFLGQMDKPDCDGIEGLSPAISIDQKTTSKNPRSTVGTVTEIYDYLRLLYARVGIPHCPICQREISNLTVDQITDKILDLRKGKPEDIKIMILAPIARGEKGEFTKELAKIVKSGFVRARIDGEIQDIQPDMRLKKTKKHNVEIIVDRLILRNKMSEAEYEEIRLRICESVETVFKHSDGTLMVNLLDNESESSTDITFSKTLGCPEHNVSLSKLEPRMFSFNSPFGACKTCSGLGVSLQFDLDKIIPNPELSLEEGAIRAPGWRMDRYLERKEIIPILKKLSKKMGFSLKTPVKDLPKDIMNRIIYGPLENDKKQKIRYAYYEPDLNSYVIEEPNNFEDSTDGVIPDLQRILDGQSIYTPELVESECMSYKACPKCHGGRLTPEILAVTIGGINIQQFCEMDISQALEFVKKLKLPKTKKIISEPILKEISQRLQFLLDVGLEYLTLSRPSGTLSGGESQRIRLATQIGSHLVGVLYILDEPSIGLHQRDNQKLISTLKELQRIGNTVIVVEHDEETIECADFIVDVGPGAGTEGGNIVCAGDVNKIKACSKSITGQYLSGKKQIDIPQYRRKGNGKFLKVRDAHQNNLKHINIDIPLNTFTCITGVSGSGKSTLVNNVIYDTLFHKLNRGAYVSGIQGKIEDYGNLDKIIAIDQSPIGRTPRSNPATYTGVFSDIRDLFARTAESKVRGYTNSRFSFNVNGGRCEACAGDGIKKIQMHFLSDIYVPCEECHGTRYNRETLQIKYRGKNISDILDMTIDEAVVFFENIPKIRERLETIRDVGLGYVKVGQSATTLSGGEAQRVKLATELSKRETGNTLYILDEPTTGLHTHDVKKLIAIIQKLVNIGNTVLVIEHNLDLIKCADHIVDLGPEGGFNGGNVVFEGTPEKILECKNSYTGKFLKKFCYEKTKNLEIKKS